MLKNVILIFLFLASLYGCKKEDQSISTGNYIEINGDRRAIDATSSNVDISCGTYGYPGWQFYILDKQFSTGIAGFSNNQIEIIVDVYDTGLSKNDYPLTAYTGNETKGLAQILIRPRKDGKNIIGLLSKNNSGGIKYSFTNSKRIVEFNNVKLFDTKNTSYSVSGRMQFD